MDFILVDGPVLQDVAKRTGREGLDALAARADKVALNSEIIEEALRGAEPDERAVIQSWLRHFQ
ncbi:MAG: hypothetical protein AAGE80_11065 [Pseudomonadota bacterium]